MSAQREHGKSSDDLSTAEILALAEARHGDPFSVLGMQTGADGAICVRAILPMARRAEVLDESGRAVATLEHKSGDVFVGRMPRRRNRFAYRLNVTWGDGTVSSLVDAYSFGPLISDLDLHLLTEGTHLRPFEVLGAHVCQLGGNKELISGVRFALWAPNARRVSVVGDFNAWDGRRHAMRHRGASGVWEIFVPHAKEGERYKFELLDANGALLPLKADPYARAAQMRPETASIVATLPEIRKLPTARKNANGRRSAISIYEVHTGSWKRHSDGRFLDWDELSATLPQYASNLGFTHIELMPVSEYPFDGSWGYQALGMFAPSARFGPSEGFVRFVESCHQHGLGLLIDWVPAHFPSDPHGLAQFDGTALYEYADPREGFHRDWNTLIYNFGRNEVRNFLMGSALYWLERFGIDGLRVDAVASMLYRDYSRPTGEWVPNSHGGRENLEAISLLKRVNEIVGENCPGAITVAEESTAFPAVSAPTYAGGLGFHFKWNMGWMNDTLKYMQEDPVNRRWHHNKMTFGMVYAFSENFVLPLSHDEVVHGKRSILGKMPGDEWQQFANLRAYYGFMWGHPGKKLLFMGQEFAQTNEWNHESALPWEILSNPRNEGVARLVGDLNRLYRSFAALHELDCEPEGFEWIDSNDADNSIFSWLRRSASGESVLIVSNFTPMPCAEFRLGVPAGFAGWREILNTDANDYGGSGVGNGGATLRVQNSVAHGRAQSIQLTLPPLATLFLEAAR